MLSDSQIVKFQEFYKERFGVEIDKKEALTKGLKLVRLFEFVYQSPTNAQLKNIKKEREAKALNVEQALHKK